MQFTTVFIKAPNKWETVTSAVMALARNKATGVSYIASGDELSDDPTKVEIAVMQLEGAAAFALEIYWKEMVELEDDTVGMHLASMLKSDVIIQDRQLEPFGWLLLTANGKIINIDLDVVQLDASSRVVFNVS